MRKHRLGITFFRAFLFVLVSGPSLYAHAETWKIITLDWPPYTAQNMPGDGVAAQALKAAMKTVGVDVEFVFMPWTRGAYEVRKEEYVGIFPTWTDQIFENAKLSPPLFQSPIGFVHQRDNHHPWKALSDLRGLRIGTVQDYHYPEELTALGRSGVLKLSPVTSDEQNLFKVAYKRLDLTVVDLVNAKFLIESRYPDLKPLVAIDPKVYKNADLFIALKPDSKLSERILKIKKALRKVSQQKFIDKALKNIAK